MNGKRLKSRFRRFTKWLAIKSGAYPQIVLKRRGRYRQYICNKILSESMRKFRLALIEVAYNPNPLLPLLEERGKIHASR